MPREQEYRARDKVTHQMTRDGLVERNESTGQQARISQRGQEFDLRAQAATRENVAPAPLSMPKGRSRQQTAAGADAADARSEPPRPPLRDAPGDRGDMVSAPTAVAAPPGKLQFTQDEAAVPDAPAGSNGLGKKLAQKQARLAEHSAAKLPAPAAHSAATAAAFSETAKPAPRLQFEPTPAKTPAGAAKGSPVAAGRQAAGRLAHAKLREAEDGNVGTEAAHTAEQAAETVGRSALRFKRSRKAAKNTATAQQTATVRRGLQHGPVSGQGAAAGRAASQSTSNPKFTSNPISRLMQKQRQKRQYAKAAREAKRAGTTIKKAAGAAGKVVSNAAAAAARHPAVLAVLGGLLLLLIITSTLFTSCSGMLAGGMGTALGSSYLASDADIDGAELDYTEWEADLQLQIANIERDRPGYDEYRRNVADIGHNPFELMAFLTATHGDFTEAGVAPLLRAMFDEQYQLTLTEETETRYHDPEDENEDGDLEPYEWKILHITLSARSFTGVAAGRMDAAETQHHALLMESRGNRQHVASPFPFNWLPYVSDYYAYRVHPISGGKDYHKAADIALPAGIEIHAAHAGTVTTAASNASYGNYIVLEGADGITTKYAHCQSLRVSAGQAVAAGDVIATVGSTGDSTGPHLHFEVLKDGQYLNPLYFADIPRNEASFPGSPGGMAGEPGAPMGDGSYAALLAEAQRHIGKPYVFGASGPEYFDCSGYICWVFNQSGAASLGRTTAQGLYNMCAPVSQPMPGDLVFFHSTYSTPNTVTHVGLYIGGGQMLHCGDPIGYANLSSSYWQQHFFAYGRLN